MKGLILLTLMASAVGIGEVGGEQTSETADTSSQTSLVSSSEQSSSEETASSSEEEKNAVDAVADILAEIFDAQTVAMIMSWVAYAGTIIGLAIKLKSLKKQNQLTLSDVKDAVLTAVDGKVEESVKNSLSNAMDKVVDNESSITNAINVMAQALITDDADTKIALLKLLKDGGANVDSAIETIEGEKKTEAENKAQAQEKLEAIIEAKNKEEEGDKTEEDSAKGLI